MGMFGTSNTSLSSQINQQSQANFKSVHNLLTLQENHVEEFFQYHGKGSHQRPFCEHVANYIGNYT